MPRRSLLGTTGRAWKSAPMLALALALTAGPALRSLGADPGAAPPSPPRPRTQAPAAPTSLDLDAAGAQLRKATATVSAWYARTPPSDRVTWGGLTAAACLALGVLLERWVRLRPRRVVPDDFSVRFLERLQDGRLDRGKALDYCELNPSPAARVALAAVKRWGRPVADLERGTTLAQRVEVESLRRHVGTLRRVAALAPLLGLLGSLTALSRALAALGTTSSATAAVWGPALAAALWPVTAGVALATLALVAYDGLAGRVERLSDSLGRIAAETIDAIALALPLPVATDPRAPHASTHNHGPHQPAGPTRATHQVRLEIPMRNQPRVPLDDDDELD